MADVNEQHRRYSNITLESVSPTVRSVTEDDYVEVYSESTEDINIAKHEKRSNTLLRDFISKNWVVSKEDQQLNKAVCELQHILDQSQAIGRTLTLPHRSGPIHGKPPDLANGKWIWTKEAKFSFHNVPVAARPFRKVIPLLDPVDSATIDISCDNFYTLYVNGKLVGSGYYWAHAQRYNVIFPPTSSVIIAVYAAQDPITVGPAGLIAAGVLWNSFHDYPPLPFQTDQSWKCINSDESIPDDFMNFDFLDEEWDNAYLEGGYGMPPWHNVTKPRSSSGQGPGIADIDGLPDAPFAYPALVVGEFA